MREEIEEFLSRIDRAGHTKRMYTWALKHFLDAVGDYAPLNMQTYESYLSEISNYSPSTKRVILAALSGLYEFHEAGDPNRIKKLYELYMRRQRIQPVIFDRESIEKMLTYCNALCGSVMELRDRAFFITLADSGLRISELARLKRGDVDWSEYRVFVEGKGGKFASVRLSGRSIQALQDYLMVRAEMDGKSGKPLSTLPLFAQHGRIKHTKQITVDGMRKSLKMRMKEVGVNVRIHDFRHYFVTIVMQASGGNLKLAQELARHESTTTTQRYAHFSDNELDREYENIFDGTNN
jgi:integrase